MSGIKRFMYIAACASLALMFLFFFLMVNFVRDIFCALGITSMMLCYHFTIRLVIGGVTDRIKPEQFNPESRRFREFKFEKRFYKVIRVKKWKKFVPTYDKRLFSLRDNSVNDIIVETCRAETVHWLCAASSLVTVSFSAVLGALPAFLVTGIIGALVELVFVIVQRYNRPRLIKHTVRRR